MKIEKDNKVFQSAAYLQDASKFYIIKMNFVSDTLLLYSDEESYVICRGAEGLPTWIWTADDIRPEQMAEAAETLATKYLTPERNQLTSKKSFYEYLQNSKYPYLIPNDYFEMGTLECHRLKEPRKCDGCMEPATLDDLAILATYFYNDCQEMNGVKGITMVAAQEAIEKKIASGTFFVWRNEAGKIVSMADYKITESQAKIGAVYTPKEERCKGYASNLIHDITELLLEMQLVPLLYTDYNYVASNTAYKNAGYEDTGMLITFSCSKPKTIRPVTEQDIPACVQLIRTSFQTVADTFGFTVENAPRFTAFATTSERLLWQLCEEQRPMYAYYKGDQPVGYYSLALLGDGTCELNNLCVHPEYRHKGIGEALVADAFGKAREFGCTRMNIGIVEENQVLRKWYEDLGFLHTGAKKFDFFPFTCGYMVKNL